MLLSRVRAVLAAVVVAAGTLMPASRPAVATTEVYRTSVTDAYRTMTWRVPSGSGGFVLDSMSLRVRLDEGCFKQNFPSGAHFIVTIARAGHPPIVYTWKLGRKRDGTAALPKGSSVDDDRVHGTIAAVLPPIDPGVSGPRVAGRSLRLPMQPGDSISFNEANLMNDDNPDTPAVVWSITGHRGEGARSVVSSTGFVLGAAANCAFNPVDDEGDSDSDLVQ